MNSSAFNQNFGDFNDVFNQMFGQHSANGPFGGATRDIDVTYHVEVKDVFDCATKQINVTMPNGMSKPVSINIPHGISHGSRVKYANMSPQGGDLYVRFMFKKTKEYEADNNNNLTSKRTIDLKVAAFGGELIINTLDDRSIKVTIHPGTQSGTKLRIPESGLPRRNQPNGDLIVEIKVIIPKLSIPDLYKTVQDVL
jgi:DnaJ-class molecular chaperone